MRNVTAKRSRRDFISGCGGRVLTSSTSPRKTSDASFISVLAFAPTADTQVQAVARSIITTLKSARVAALITETVLVEYSTARADLPMTQRGAPPIPVEPPLT
jgi:hypothetical protein